MSRSNFYKPFYVEVGTSVVSIRCASNHDVVVRYDYVLHQHALELAEDACNRMNKEVGLSRPLRNCDVGTAEEQSARFDAHCRNHMGCLTCPLRDKDGGVPKHCEFAWSQMPYEEGETK